MPGTSAAAAPRVPPSPAFEYVGGDPALDLVNTVDWTSVGRTNERLTDYPALLAWAVGAGVVSPAHAERLRRAAAGRPREAQTAHQLALRVRGLLHAIFGTLEDGGPPPAALRELNLLLAEALGRLALRRDERDTTRRLRWDWTDKERRLDSVLWPVLRGAAELLTSEEADRIRICAGPDCGWMYVDRSRNGFRRWCQMRTCGTREKSRRRREG